MQVALDSEGYGVVEKNASRLFGNIVADRIVILAKYQVCFGVKHGLLEKPIGYEKLTWDVKCSVFESLYELGYNITCGSTFGADFLLYEEDPGDCHACRMVVIEGKSDVAINQLGRVGHMVGKRVVFAKMEKDVVVYQHIEEVRQEDKKLVFSVQDGI